MDYLNDTCNLECDETQLMETFKVLKNLKSLNQKIVIGKSEIETVLQALRKKATGIDGLTASILKM